MRAITVRQPWAWAIAHGGKDVENRVSNIAGRYRGLVAIHAGLAFDYDAPIDDFIASAIRSGASLDAPGGVVIGVVDLTDVHHGRGLEGPSCCWRDADVLGWVPADPHDDDPRSTYRCSPWAMDGHHHLILANPRPLATPVPAKGRLGLWTLPADVEAAVVAQLGGAA